MLLLYTGSVRLVCAGGRVVRQGRLHPCDYTQWIVCHCFPTVCVWRERGQTHKMCFVNLGPLHTHYVKSCYETRWMTEAPRRGFKKLLPDSLSMGECLSLLNTCV